MTPEVKEALLLRVQPGDVIVLKVARSLSQQEAASLKEQWMRAVNGSSIAETRVVILDNVLNNGVDITIVRADSENVELTKIAREQFAKTTGSG